MLLAHMTEEHSRQIGILVTIVAIAAIGVLAVVFTAAQLFLNRKSRPDASRTIFYDFAIMLPISLWISRLVVTALFAGLAYSLGLPSGLLVAAFIALAIAFAFAAAKLLRKAFGDGSLPKWFNTLVAISWIFAAIGFLMRF